MNTLRCRCNSALLHAIYLATIQDISADAERLILCACRAGYAGLSGVAEANRLHLHSRLPQPLLSIPQVVRLSALAVCFLRNSQFQLLLKS